MASQEEMFKGEGSILGRVPYKQNLRQGLSDKSFITAERDLPELGIRLGRERGKKGSG